MKARVIVAVIAIPILFLAIVYLPVWVLGIITGVIAACCAWEFLRCTEKELNPRIPAYAAVSAFIIPFLTAFYDGGRVEEIVIFLLFAVMFAELMLSFRKSTTMEFETVAGTLMAGGVMPVLLTALVRLGLREHNAPVYALLPFVAAFSSDIGGYLVGLTLGKHKLTPHLSPNKTLEGSVGSFVLSIGLTVVYGLVLELLGYEVNLLVLGVYGFLGSLAAQLGDLSFSAVKRLFGVKDYGNLIPGHGGMLDRFDSMFWVAPLMWLLTLWVPAIHK